MDEINTLERQKRYSGITAEERQLIDAAVAEGRVTRVPTGASAFARADVWKPGHENSMKLVAVEEDPDHKPGAIWRRQIAQDGRLAGTRSRSRRNPAGQDK